MVRIKSWSGKSSSHRDFINNDKEVQGIHVQCYGSSWGLGKYAIAPAPHGTSMEEKQNYYIRCVELLPELQKDFNKKTKSFPEDYVEKFVNYFDLGRLNKKELSIFKKSVKVFLDDYTEKQIEEITNYELEKKTKKSEYVKNRNKQIKAGTVKVGEPKPVKEKPITKKTNEPVKGYNVVSSSEELMRLIKEKREKNHREKERRERRDAGINAHFEALARKEQEEAQKANEDVRTR